MDIYVNLGIYLALEKTQKGLICVWLFFIFRHWYHFQNYFCSSQYNKVRELLTTWDVIVQKGYFETNGIFKWFNMVGVQDFWFNNLNLAFKLLHQSFKFFSHLLIPYGSYAPQLFIELTYMQIDWTKIILVKNRPTSYGMKFVVWFWNSYTPQ